MRPSLPKRSLCDHPGNQFADESSAERDLLVGADGANPRGSVVDLQHSDGDGAEVRHRQVLCRGRYLPIGADDVHSRSRVRLTRLLHASADDGFQVMVSGHVSSSGTTMLRPPPLATRSEDTRPTVRRICSPLPRLKILRGRIVRGSASAPPLTPRLHERPGACQPAGGWLGQNRWAMSNLSLRSAARTG